MMRLVFILNVYIIKSVKHGTRLKIKLKKANDKHNALLFLLKGDQICSTFLHITLRNVFLLKSIDVFTTFVNQNMCNL